MALSELEHANDHMEQCIDNCFEAAQAAEWCADECTGSDDEGMIRCARLCRDVADLTTLHARLMARNSAYHDDLAATCADACEECADVCEGFDEKHCQAAAAAMRDCAETCREMAS